MIANQDSKQSSVEDSLRYYKRRENWRVGVMRCRSKATAAGGGRSHPAPPDTVGIGKVGSSGNNRHESTNEILTDVKEARTDGGLVCRR